MAKIRQGFVSNSSSSSFVVAGIQVSSGHITNVILEELDNKGFCIKYPGEGGAPDDTYIVGKTLASFADDDYTEGDVFSLDAILTIINDAKMALPLKEDEYEAVGVFTGTELC